MSTYQPRLAVDLASLADLSDREVAIRLGSRKPDHDAPFIARERAGDNDRKIPYGRSRCLAGLDRLGLRCRAVALPGQPWCGTHLPKVIPKAALPVKTKKPALLPAPPPERPTPPINPAPAGPEQLAMLSAGLRLLEEAVLTLTRIEAQLASRSDSVPPASPALLTVAEAADYLRLSTPYVYKLLKNKRLPHIRLAGEALRLDKASLDEWLKSKELPAVR